MPDITSLLREDYIHQPYLNTQLDDDRHILDTYRSMSPVFEHLHANKRRQMSEEIDNIQTKIIRNMNVDFLKGRQKNAILKNKELLVLCKTLKCRLENPKLPENPTTDAALLLGLRLLNPAIEQLLGDMLTSHTDFQEGMTLIQDSITFVNERRLYWVWAGSTVSTLLSLFAEYLHRAEDALRVLGDAGRLTGTLSFTLYFMRGGIELYFCLHKFSVSEQRMTDLDISFSQNLAIHLSEHKYRLINDWIWGFCNLACFAVLVGTEVLSNAASVLTLTLLLMDLSLAVYRLYFEEQAVFLQKISGYQNELERLQADRVEAIQNKQSKSLLDEKIKALTDKKQYAERIWHMQKAALVVDLCYAAGLVGAFSLILIAGFCTNPVLALALAVTGTLLCFVFNIAYTWSSMQMNVDKSKSNYQEAIQTLEALKAQRKELDPSDQHKIALLDHEIQLAEATSEKEKKEIQRHQNLQLVAVIRDTLIPPLVFASLGLMPLGIGLPLLAVTIVLAGSLYYWMEHMKADKPDPAHTTDFKLFKQMTAHHHENKHEDEHVEPLRISKSPSTGYNSNF